jgi:hypothetical protein
MSRQSLDVSSQPEGAAQSEGLFPVVWEFSRQVTVLNRIGVLTLLPKLESIGGIGIDLIEHPTATQEQVAEIFPHNRKLAGRKGPQGC